MRVEPELLLLDGPAGKIEVILENPGAPKGIALIGHPHPLFGGANTNKVAQTLARTLVQLGYAALRPQLPRRRPERRQPRRGPGRER